MDDSRGLDSSHSEIQESGFKKCPYCAELIREEAILCRYCGRSLPSNEFQKSPAGILRSTQKTKKPWLAVLLNCFPLIMGLGYIYLGKWTRFVIVFIIQLFSLAPMTWLGLRDLTPLLLAGVWIFTLFDGYTQAKLYNMK